MLLCKLDVALLPIVSDNQQSTLRPPEVHMFYRKIELCIVRMGDNDMRTACTLEQEMVDHVILELHIKEASRYN